MSLNSFIRKVNQWLSSPVQCFAAAVLNRFHFSSLIYINIKLVFFKIPPNIESWLKKYKFDAWLLKELLFSTMNDSIVWLKPYKTRCYVLHKHSVLSVFCWHGFSVFNFLYNFDVSMIAKTNVTYTLYESNPSFSPCP